MHQPREGPVIDEHRGDEIRGEVSRVEAPHHAALRPRYRAPDYEVDSRLEDHANEPDHKRDAVLHLHRERELEPGLVRLEQCPHTRTGSRSVPSAGAPAGWALPVKTCSITSSIGGSSTVRSAIGTLASRRSVTRAVSLFSTRSVIRPSSALTTSPKRDRSAVPSASSTTIVLCGEKRFTSSLNSPSKSSWPWWMTITRLHSASTSSM